MKKIVNYFCIVIMSVIAMNLSSCSKDDDNNTSFGNEKEPAPEQLPIGYVIAENNASASYPLYYWIKNTTHGWHNDSRNMVTNTPIYTTYSYKKISSNTAYFSFSITQYINGPISKRNFYYEGTLTFKTPDNFSYEGAYKYYADGIYQKDYSFSEPSLTFFPENKYPFIKTMP